MSGLNNLTAIGGEFSMEFNGQIVNFTGLEALNTVGGNVDFQYNSITDMSGLNNLTTVGGDFNIVGNGSLINLNGLESLISVGGNFDINDNKDNLVSLSGLNNLTTIGGSLYINTNWVLADISALENLTSVRQLLLEFNTSLTNLNGLEGVTALEQGLAFLQNDALSDLSGLSNLVELGGELRIEFSPSFYSLSALSNIDLSNVSSLSIRSNPNLSLCSLDGICSYLINGGDHFIDDNPAGCSSLEDVLSNCGDARNVNYVLFYDINENAIQDSNEPIYAPASVSINTAGFAAFANNTNGGLIFLSDGTHTITYNQEQTPNWELTTDNASFTITLDENNPTDTLYFGLRPLITTSDIRSSLISAAPRCNDFVAFSLWTDNNGTTIGNGTTWLQMDENIESPFFINPPDTMVAPNLYGWHFSNLAPGNSIEKEMILGLPGPPDFEIGNAVNFSSLVNYVDATGTYESDIYQYPIIVECAYDPNDKLVNPDRMNGYTLMEEALTYTVRFQNTGNAEAFDVVIRDTLSEHLNPATFRVIGSSHEQVLTTTLGDNKFLTFDFKNIFLPDSTTNFEGSQGYVTYRIQSKADLPEMTSVTNSASIYFDFNPPILTNTTENILLSTFDFDEDGFDIFVDCDDMNAAAYPDAEELPNNGVDEDCDGEDLILSIENLEESGLFIYPNPTTHQVRIGGEHKGRIRLEIFDSMGKKWMQNTFESSTVLDLSRLPVGIYFVALQLEATRVFSKLEKM